MIALLKRRQQELALAGAGAILTACSLLPLLLLLGEAASSSQPLAPLRLGRLAVLVARSTGLAILVTALSLLIGIPLGFLVGRTDARGGRLAALVHVFPVFLPPFLVALGWFHLFGTRGLFGGDMTARVLFSEAGLVAVLITALAPIASVFTALGLQGIDPSLEEAARVVARPVRAAVRILLPAAAPAVVLAAIVIFTLAFSELGVPMFLRVDTFPAAVFARLGGIDYAPGEAFALALPLLPVAVGLLALERRFVGARSYAVLGVRSLRHEPRPLGRWRGPATLLLWLAAALSAAPIAALAWRAVRAGELGRLAGWLGRATWNSAWTSAVAASVIVAIGLVLGHAVARRVRGARVLEAVSVLAFVTPAAVLGVGLIATWNRPALQGVYGSAAILVVGFVARYAVVGVRSVAALAAQTPLHLEEAAAAVGAGFWRRLTRIFVPLQARGLGFAWLLTVVFCMRDLELAALYYPPGGEPATVRIFTLEANGPEGIVAGLALVHVAMTAAVLAAGGAVLRRRWPS